jgi:hypothetical protein
MAERPRRLPRTQLATAKKYSHLARLWRLPKACRRLRPPGRRRCPRRSRAPATSGKAHQYRGPGAGVFDIFRDKNLNGRPW